MDGREKSRLCRKKTAAIEAIEGIEAIERIALWGVVRAGVVYGTPS